MAQRGRNAGDEVVAIRMEDGTWYGIPRAIVERCRVNEEMAARLETELEGSEVQAYTSTAPFHTGIPKHGIVITTPTMIPGPGGITGYTSPPDFGSFEDKLP
jgi:hypothetical protein